MLNQVSLFERCFNIKEPKTATMTESETAPVNNRLAHSIVEWPDCSFVGANDSAVHFGQVVHPKPEPVTRTLAPVTIIAAIKKHATTVIQ